MKKMTLLSMLLVVAVFVALVVYTASAEDFTPPYTIEKNLEDTKAWNKTAEDLFDTLEKADLVDRTAWQEVDATGTASQAWKAEGITVYFWDIKALATNSAEYQTLVRVERDGIFPEDTDNALQNGPFVFIYDDYTSDREVLVEVLRDFGRTETEPEVDDSRVWTMKLDDLAAYMEESGLVDPNSRITVNYGTGEKVRSGYRYDDVVDIYYYDQDMMLFEPGSAACNEWESINATGTVLYSNGEIGTYYVRGPFVLHFYHWNRDAISDEDKQVILDYFTAFCQPQLAEEEDDSLVWTLKLNDLAAYMEQSGLIDPDSRTTIGFGAGEKVRSGYRYDDVVDVYFYDQEMLMFEPGSDVSREWESIVTTGVAMYANGEICSFYVRGPFALYFNQWSKVELTDDEKQAIVDYFYQFAK